MTSSSASFSPLVDLGEQPYYKVSPKLTKVRIIVLFIWLIPLVLIAVVVFGAGLANDDSVLTVLGAVLLVLALLLLAWLLWLIPRQVRALGYATAPEELLLARGIMFRSVTAVPYGRMQYVDVNAGPIDRMFGLAKVTLHTASAATSAAIPGLERAEADRLRALLTQLGEARMAGL